MPQPIKTRHGVYKFRKVVPKTLRAAVGRSEIVISLDTKNATEAKARYKDASDKADLILARARAAPAPLSQKQVVGLTGAWFRHLHDSLGEHPTSIASWERLVDLVKVVAPTSSSPLAIHRPKYVPDRAALRMEVRMMLDRENLRVDEGTEGLLITAFGSRVEALQESLWRNLKQQYAPAPELAEFPAWVPPAQTAPTPVTQSLLGLFDAYAFERKPREKTRREWRAYLTQFIEFLKHDDAALVKKADVVRWKDSLVARGLARNTINESRLTCIKRTYSWAIDNGHLETNPADRVAVAGGRDTDAPRPFTLAEAALILRSTRARIGVQRWAPWIAAYTGSRIGEVVQLRVVDVRQIAGFWCVAYTREGGRSTKNKNSVRTVPLHRSVIDEGFLDYVTSIPASGFLFPEEVRKDSRGMIGVKASERCGVWVRSLGIDDPAVQPNHGWRHLMKDLCRDCGIDKHSADVLQGHANKDISDHYGSGHAIRTLAAHVEKLPLLCPPLPVAA